MISRAASQTWIFTVLVIYFELINCLTTRTDSSLDVGSQIMSIQDQSAGTWNVSRTVSVSIPNEIFNKHSSQGKRGRILASGYWKTSHSPSIPLVINGENYFYCANTGNEWFIQKLNANGTIGDEIQHGRWKQAYPLAFSYSLRNRTFLYGCCGENERWFTQELLRGGILDPLEADSGHWKMSHHVIFPFTLEGRQFFYGQASTRWFIQELLPNGLMGSEVSCGHWDTKYEVAFPFQINSRQFFYRHRPKDHYWTIQELLPGGQMGHKIVEGFWNAPHDSAFHFTIGENHYFYRQSKSQWHIQKLLASGEIGEETDQGPVEMEFSIKFPYVMKGRSFFYALNPKSYYFCTFELL